MVSRGVQNGLNTTEILPLHSVKGKNDKAGWRVKVKMIRGGGGDTNHLNEYTSLTYVQFCGRLHVG